LISLLQCPRGQAAEEEMPDYDYSGMLRDFEAFMTAWRYAFDEAELHPKIRPRFDNSPNCTC